MGHEQSASVRAKPAISVRVRGKHLGLAFGARAGPTAATIRMSSIIHRRRRTTSSAGGESGYGSPCPHAASGGLCGGLRGAGGSIGGAAPSPLTAAPPPLRALPARPTRRSCAKTPGMAKAAIQLVVEPLLGRRGWVEVPGWGSRQAAGAGRGWLVPGAPTGGRPVRHQMGALRDD